MVLLHAIIDISLTNLLSLPASLINVNRLITNRRATELFLSINRTVVDSSILVS